MKRAVFSFYNIRSGKFSWWDDFPMRITQKLKKHDIEHVCFYNSYGGNTPYSKNDCHPVPHGALNDISWIRKCVHSLSKAYKSVIFHTHSFDIPLLIWIETMLKKHHHWVMTEHHSWPDYHPEKFKKYLRIAGRSIGLLPERIYGVSPKSLDRIEDLYGKKDIRCIYNGIELPKLSLDFSEKPKPTNAIFVGRLDKNKGIWPMVKAFKILKDKDVEAHLTIVGDGGIVNALKQYIDENNIDDRVSLVGYQKNPLEFFQKADFCIIPYFRAKYFSLNR